MIRSRAAFISRHAADGNDETPLQPFVSGSLDPAVIEWQDITAEPLTTTTSRSFPQRGDRDYADDDARAELFARTGMAVVNLCPYLSFSTATPLLLSDKDDRIRSAALAFLSSDEGDSFLRARFGRYTVVRPTHVTRRSVPPDGMSLVHVDYPKTHTLYQLIGEWWKTWEPLLMDLGKDPAELDRKYRLMGVVTLWIYLPDNTGEVLEDHPLIVADASTVTAPQDTTVYRVTSGSASKHSVGVFYSSSLQWYHIPHMTWGQAWLFDTQTNPHVSVDIGRNCGFRRRSCEVRCLVLQSKT